MVGARPDGWWRDRPAALRRLLDEVIRWRAEVGEPVLVVADGHPTARLPEGSTYGVDVRYARSSARDAADDLIVRLLEDDLDPATAVVVTSDRALRERASARGAAVEWARTFLDRLATAEARRRDRVVLDHLGVAERDLLDHGGEARVFALDDDRVLRLPHPGTPAGSLEERRLLLEHLQAGAPDVPFALPRVLDHVEVDGRLLVVERRLPGRSGLDALADRSTDRVALVRNHLDAAAAIARLPCPAAEFGEIYGNGAVRAATFAGWSRARLEASLGAAGPAFAHVDAGALTTELVAVLPEAEPERPVLAHLDAYLGNMLAAGSTITAVLDFGPMAIAGVRALDPLVAIAYLAPEITPEALDADREVARQWAAEHGLAHAVDVAERWIAAYWAAATGDERLQQWCRRILTAR